MSRNGAGTYSLPSGNPVVTGTTISSTTHNNTLSDIASALTGSIAANGETTITANIPMAGFKLTGLAAGSATGNSLRYEQLFTTNAVALLGAMDWVKGANIDSASTINLTTATGNAVHITGTTTITAVTLGSGLWRLVIFDGILTLTHHTTNNNLPGGVNITTAANDRALYWSDGTTVYCVSYIPAAGNMISGSTAGGDLTGTYPNPTLGSVISAGGPTGNSTTIPVITYDAKGRLTAVTTATVAAPTVAQGSSLVLIGSTQTASNVASIDFTSGIDGTYSEYILVGSGVIPITNNVNAYIRFYSGSFQATNYDYAANGCSAAGGATAIAGAAQVAIIIAPNVGQVTNSSGPGALEFTLHFYNPASTTLYKNATFHSSYNNATANDYFTYPGGGRWKSISAITGIQFLFHTGNISLGTFSLYGVRKS